MKKQLLLLAMLFIPMLGFTGSKSDAIIGIWLTEIEDAKIEIYRSSGKYYGKVVWMAEPKDEDGNPQVDKYNPDAKKQSRPIFNMDILVGLVYDDDGEWDGAIYDPKDGKSYTCKVWISDGDLMVRGYSGWLYKTKTWTKV